MAGSVLGLRDTTVNMIDKMLVLMKLIFFVKDWIK